MNIRNCGFIVTGGASGLGAASARALAGAGGRVLIADLNEAAGSALAKEVGGRFERVDVTSEDDGKRAVASAVQAFGALHGVVNCAGVGTPGKILGKDGVLPLAAFRKVVEINLIGTFNLLRLGAEAMSRNAPNTEGERGVLVNTASVAGYEGQIGQPAYAASKAGVIGLTLPAARELARFGIRVVTIAPGLFETPMAAGLTPEIIDALGKSVPFPSRFGRPAEFAQLVQAIVENPMLNGETIRLDGALRMAPK